MSLSGAIADQTYDRKGAAQRDCAQRLATCVRAKTQAIKQKVSQSRSWVRGSGLIACWTRETGVIPAALAGLLLGAKAPGAEIIASITFIAILMTILIQAPTTKWLAQTLGLLEDDKKKSAPRQAK